MTIAATAPPSPQASAGATLERAAPVDLVTKLFYGFGSVAYGIKDNGFQTFVLLFYNQLWACPRDLWGWRSSLP